MAIVTRPNFTARGRLQNIVFQTYWNGKIVMRSRPSKYRKSTNQSSLFNRTTMKTALTIASNWYIPFGQFYFNPPPPYERSQASFIGLFRKYAVEISQQGNYLDPNVLASVNFSFINALPDNKLSFNVLSFGGTLSGNNLSFNFSFLSSTNPNDDPNDSFSMSCVCTNQPEAVQQLSYYDDRQAGSSFGTFSINNFAQEKEYIIFAGYSRQVSGNTRDGFYSNFFGYFAIKNGILYPVTQRTYLQRLPF